MLTCMAPLMTRMARMARMLTRMTRWFAYYTHSLVSHQPSFMKNAFWENCKNSAV